MKHIIMTFAAIFAFGIAAQAQGTATVDAKKSILEWEAKKIGGGHNGTVGIQSGTLKLNKNEISGGSFVIDMTSITCLDIENADYNAKLIGHLNSDDFFSTEKFPTATLTIKKVVRLKANSKGSTHNIYADLTIKGITNEVVFPASVVGENGMITADAAFTVDRAKYDVRYGSTSFFPNIGDKAIGNDMNFKVKIVAKQ
jgi:polyisoprenoid-binding protein YceI